MPTEPWPQTSTTNKSQSVPGERIPYGWATATTTPSAGAENDDPKNIAAMPEYSPNVDHARQRVGVWRRKRSNFEKLVTAKVAAARALSHKLELRSRIEAAVDTIRGLQLINKTRKFAGDFRVEVKPRMQRLSQTVGRKYATGCDACHFAENSCRAGNAMVIAPFWRRNIRKNFYGQRRHDWVVVFDSAGNEFRGVLAASGTLDCGLRGNVVVRLYCRVGRGDIVPLAGEIVTDSSELLHNAVRWLRAPIYPLHIRELGSMGKAHTERRA